MELSLNRRIEVLWKHEYYKSVVQDSRDSTFMITIPMKGNEYLPIPIGESVELHYYEKDIIYKFESTVISRENKGLPVLVLRNPKEVKKIQRRKYVRIPVTSYVRYMKIDKNYKLRRPDAATLNSMNKTTVLDVSGGGIRFKSNENLKDQLLLVQISFNELEIMARGQIVRCIYDDIERVYDCGLSFIEIGSQEREKLISYIFKLMRQQIRKA
ncbi:flagellar brake protein [Oceanirhabdus sp. W0125-5]|uniref:flagellar brake protein n=1 Tax=Oceanirhabdus sp. W0125-5 TaxID=2999116 RepID=UPI0022F2F11D|nr:flagellar brake domain-containing protein [Oceanirhabdus sp. W0125-5]WBW95412.1 PilZ domain-containing protein [Oceanirhabdus sp. W0125-5]